MFCVFRACLLSGPTLVSSWRWRARRPSAHTARPPPTSTGSSSTGQTAPRRLQIVSNIHHWWNVDASHKRRINTEEKAKVVAAVWGTELLQFLAVIAILHYAE